MPADRRDCSTYLQGKLGEWAFLLERLLDSFRLHDQTLFHKTDSKGVLWRAFAYFRLVAKVSACPGTRGKSCASRQIMFALTL